MANTSLIKRSSVASKVPTTSDLSLGELAVNTYDGKLFLKKSVSGTESIVDLTDADTLDGQHGSYYTGYTDTAISNLIDSSPAALNTLNELAAALNDDANFSTTVTNSIATKLPLAGGTLTGNLTISNTAPKIFLTDTNNNDDYEIRNDDGTFTIRNSTDNNDMISVASDNTTTFTGNCDFSAGIDVTGTCTATTFSGSGASLTNIPAAQLTGVLPALDGSNLTGLTVNNAQTLDNLDSTQFVRSDADDTTTGRITINRSSNEKLVLAGTSNPLIRWQEGTTDKAFIQWSTSGYLKLKNEEDGSTLRLRDNIQFSTDDSTFYTMWHGGNDGSGSSLDADTLDGVQGSSFLRSDTNTLLNGILTVGGSSVSGNEGGEIRLTHAPNGSLSGSNVTIDMNGNNFRIFEDGGNTRGYYLSISAANNNASTKIWHEANDGSGSGLDADTLDGVQGASYLRSDASDTMSGTYTISTSSDQKLILAGSNDPYIRFQEGTTNKAYIQWTSAGYFIIRNDESGENIRIGSGNNGLEFVHDSTASTVFHSGNDGSGSSLDADTLDGVQGSSYLRSDANDTSSGTIAFGTGSLDPDSFASYSGGFGSISDTGWGARGVFVHGGGTGDAAAMAHSGSKLYFGIQNGSSSNSMTTWLDVTPNTRVINFQTANNATNLQIGGNKIFHAANDGSGSGLDSDTLDGVNSTSFLRSDANDSATGVIDFLGGTSTIPAVRIKSGGSNWSEGLAIHPSSDNSYALTFFRTKASLTDSSNTWAIGNMGDNGTNNFSLIRQSLTGSSSLRGDSIFDVTQAGIFRFGFNPTVGSNSIWHAGNDGSGSGLDSDTLDGVQGSNYLRSDTSDQITGELNVTHNGGTTGSTAPAYWQANVEMQTTSNYVPAIAFHRGGYSATTLYEYDGELWINAWVARNQNGKLLSTGNFTTYDGSGSNYDADLLDGVQGSSYLRSDADDETTGYFTLNKNLSSTNNYSTVQLQVRATSGIAVIGLHRAGYSHVGIGHSAQNQLYFNMNAGTSYLNSNAGTIWGNGNDGSGSGLDADKIDGLDLTAYQNRWGGIPQIYSDGVMEIGKYIDFHEADASTADFNFRIYAQGSALHTGGGSTYGFSDINHKKNITKITDAITKIKQISGYTFNWKSNNNSGGGCIAQEVETVIPELISTVSNGDLPDGTNVDGKYLNYDGVIGLLVETCKEMISKIANLETEVNNLKSA